MSHFTIRCRACGKELVNTYCAFCEHCVGALLVTQYPREFSEDCGRGIWRFNWLPVHGSREGLADQEDAEGGRPAVYRSEGLAAALGLEDLHIAFCGHWPERGATVTSCTFKEFEAAAVLENARENGIEGLVVASAGNTARAFAWLAGRKHFPAIIVVPRMCLSEMWYLRNNGNFVPTVVVGDGDYSDAIDLARRLAQASGMPFEGGVKNIAKRDGLGIVFLEAVSHMKRLPQHYVQAVGSGAGAIAVWEMAERFVGDGRFGDRLTQLHLAQNLPFAPMVHAWRRGERSIRKEDLNPELIAEISTRVLSSRYPAYDIKGGVFDALTASGGSMYGVTNAEAEEASELFERTEGRDIVAAAAVAVAALKRAVAEGTIPRHESVLLNITGGGEEAIWAADRTVQVDGTFVSKKATDGELEELACRILKKG